MATSKKTVPLKSKKQAKKKVQLKLSPGRKPENLTEDEWQYSLRVQMAEQTLFDIKPISKESIYGDYIVQNMNAKSSYKVAFRGRYSHGNYCDCYDFKTNQLGICKHIAAVEHYIQKRPALRKQLKTVFEPSYSSMFLNYVGPHSIKLRFGTDDANKLMKLFKPYLNENHILNEKGYLQIDQLLRKAKEIQPSFVCYPDALNYILQWREQQKRQEYLSPFVIKNKLPAIKSLKVKLFPYQIHGVLFTALAGRSLLADDMGLGKTIQAIALSQLMFEYYNVSKVIIICPTSLKYQWQTEIEKYTDAASRVIEGNYLKRRDIYQEHKPPLYSIISYNMAVSDIALINDFQPDLIILDEGQRIKNYQSKVATGIKKLQSQYSLVLTGTPLENKLQELYSLLQFIDPVKTGTLFQLLSKHEVRDENNKVVAYKDLHLIKEQLKHVLLRRTKKEVLTQLPERSDQYKFVPLTLEQSELHQGYVEIIAKIIARWRSQRFLSEQDRQRLLNNLSCMRMVCNSTYVIDQTTNYQTKLTELMNILEQVIEAGDEKVVIFSQWERFTRLIAWELDSMKIGYANLNGSIPGHKRKDLFERFNHDPLCRIFLSTDAGGVGLNLQAGSIIINMDLPWNPAVLEQRIARVHRQGQTKKVSVINFVAQGTIEERMISKLKFKSALAKGILDDGEHDIFMEDSQFNILMKEVDGLVNDQILHKPDQEIQYETEAEILNEAQSTGQEEISSPHESIEGKQSLVEDDMMPEQEAVSSSVKASDFIQTASGFFSQLSQVLSNPAETENLVKSLTHKDDESGQTYLKIPVESEQVIKNVLNLFAGLMGK